MAAMQSSDKGVLVCEDDAAMMRIFQFLLRQVGIEPVWAVSRGKDVFGAVQREKPALVLLDLMLPDRDGLSVLKELKGHEATRSIPVIVVSGKEAQEQVRSALQAGAADYIIKPFDPMELGARLRQLLDSGKAFTPKDFAPVETNEGGAPPETVTGGNF